MRMYTSGCPKNQKRCWYSTGFPPPAGSKKEVLKLRSVRSIVIAPARTGRLVISRTEVTAIAQIIRGMRSNEMSEAVREQTIVVKKLILPKMEEIPATWRLKIARSTEIPLWNLESDRGGQTVHPVPTPASKIEERRRNVNDGIKSQNERLFIRGKAISATPSIRGINQFPKPPIEIGITIKKIITNAWAVTITLYKCSSPRKGPTTPSSNRIRILILSPTKPAQIPKIK